MPELLQRSKWTAEAFIALGTCLSVAVALFALLWSWKTSRDQASFQRDIEERQSAPLLVPGVKPAERGKSITVYTESGEVSKRADRLYIETDPTKLARIIIPMRNAGLGVAVLTAERPMVLFQSTQQDCLRTPPQVPGPAPGLKGFGYYAVPSGDSDQLSYVPLKGSGQETEYRAASRARVVSILVRYTDALARHLRWTCVMYAHHGKSSTGWSFVQAFYGKR